MTTNKDIPPQPIKPGSPTYTLGRAAVDIMTTGPKAFAPKTMAQKRLDICKRCTALVNGKCKFCGCQMSLKVHLAHAHCDLGNW